MKKWFQFYADFEDEEESVPMRAGPDEIKGFRRWTKNTTMVYTTFGTFKVVEEYEKFSKRLFAFVNFEEYMKMTRPQEEVTTTTKKYVIKIKKNPEKKTEEELAQLQDYYDTHQPDNNAGVYM